MGKHQVCTMSFARIYPLYIAKAERKGRTKAEVDEIIGWLTGYTPEDLTSILDKQTDFETFFAEAPKLPKSLEHEIVLSIVSGFLDERY